MICAGTEGKGSCLGDTGGPLVDDQGYLVGIESGGLGCARDTHTQECLQRPRILLIGSTLPSRSFARLLVVLDFTLN